ncbi:UTP--glucose-1-phosphate uridylyltransferase [Gottfriedia acidiceleris]|uniref:UTP--glucose-1-phosphate uridylyltransferase n=1 Tax=Bacillaceae TaxID=186817 RepID=UPI00256FEDCA|nr:MULTISPECIES: UTP--glucose-1-phosphate uridylyltransferase [unclassified Bacillus (in: firmicutes)]
MSTLADIHNVRQKEPFGLGHAILCAKKFIGNEPFAVLLGDDIIDSKTPALKQMIHKYNEVQPSILGCKEVPLQDVNKYGIVNYSKFKKDIFKVKGLIEKPNVESTPSSQAIVGRYILTPTIFEMLEQIKPDLKGEYQLTEAIDLLLTKEPVFSYLIQGNRYDIGDKFGFLQASIDFALKRTELKKPLEKYLKELVLKDDKLSDSKKINLLINFKQLKRSAKNALLFLYSIILL